MDDESGGESYMSVIMTLPPSIPELDSLPSVAILGSLYRMTVDQYERLLETGVLDDQPIELKNGLLVKKLGKKPPHVLACEALAQPSQCSFRRLVSRTCQMQFLMQSSVVIVHGSS